MNHLIKTTAMERKQLQEQFATYAEDVSVVTELAIRNQMLSAILMQYATQLLNKGESIEDTKAELLAIGGKVMGTQFVDSTILERLSQDYAQLTAQRRQLQTKITDQFLGAIATDRYAREGLGQVLDLKDCLTEYAQLTTATEQWETRHKGDMVRAMADHYYALCKAQLLPHLTASFRYQL